MLTTYLNNVPYSKFLLIEDSLEEPGKNILNYVIRSQLKLNKYNIHYFVLEGVFNRTKLLHSHPNLTFYDFTTDLKGWIDTSRKKLLTDELSKVAPNTIIVIDSLAHAIFDCGIPKIYAALLHTINSKPGVQQIVSILHQDLLENATQTLQYFEHLSTFTLKLEPKFYSKLPRVSYIYRKSSGKLIKQIEEYYFENGFLITEPVKKIDPKALVQQSLNQTLPEDLTTFRISLDDKEKESRDKLVLPYLPKNDENEGQQEGKIFYNFDNVDDWDEEDPDDDLDI